MDPDKRDRIINSAMEEFSKNAFSKASTNNIVKNAGISKGLLYHYFTSKQVLYNYIKDFTMTEMTEIILAETNWDNSDLLIRIQEIVLIKLRVFRRYPFYSKFMIKLIENQTIDEIKKSVEDYTPNIYETVYTKNIKLDQLKDDIPMDKALKIIQWTTEKYAEELLNKMMISKSELNYNEVSIEMQDMMDVLRIALFK